MVQKISRVVFPALALLTLTPFISAPLALTLGILVSALLGNPYSKKTKAWVTPLLQISVVGLGAGMDLNSVLRVGAHGVIYTAVGIGMTLVLGNQILRKIFSTEPDASLLISVGTAICGGSAIAAMSGAIRAKERDVTVALAIVFILNSVALLIFPTIGHFFNLTQTQFGLWSALAIHDTSSVVGASLQYGAQALETATTVKLARALWIVPLTLAAGAGWIGEKKNETTAAKIKKPWFILGFLICAALATWIPDVQPYSAGIYSISKKLLVLTLFLIGSHLSIQSIREVGPRPFLLGVTLWITVSIATLGAILAGWIS